MIRKTFIGISIALVVICAGIFVFEGFFGKSISNNLSNRSKDYIKSKQISEGTEFSNVLKKGESNMKGKRLTVGDCLSFITPFRVNIVRQKEGCDGYFSTDSPRGSIVAYVREGKVGTFDQMEGVSFRRQDKAYVESRNTINEHDFLMFKNTTDGYQKSAFYFNGSQYVVITLTLSTLENMDPEFNAILESLTFNTL